MTEHTAHDGATDDPEDRVVLVDIRDSPLSVDEVYRSVITDATGGAALFVGTVRDHDESRSVESLDYSAHPSVVDRLRTVCIDVAATCPSGRVAAVHRVGHLAIGDIAVVVAVSAAHRGEAIDATRLLIDTLKATVPIWKHQVFSDGTDEWVGLP